MPLVNLFGPLDRVLAAEVAAGEVQVIEVGLLVLILLNLLTRRVAYRRHRRQAEEGAEAVSRWPVHELTNLVLVLGSLYYTTLHQHAGIVMSTLVLGLFITDFFEFEARKVEARREIPLEQPKGALFASLLVLFYAGYQVLFFLIKSPLGSVV
jgi:hypothetical protein